jgi:hypothetical protein
MKRHFIAGMGDLHNETMLCSREYADGNTEITRLGISNPAQTVFLRIQALRARLHDPLPSSDSVSSLLGVGLDSYGGTHHVLDSTQTVVETARNSGSKIVFFVHQNARSAAAKILSFSPGTIHCQPNTTFRWHNIRDQKHDTLPHEGGNYHNKMELVSLSAFLRANTSRQRANSLMKTAVHSLFDNQKEIVYRALQSVLDAIEHKDDFEEALLPYAEFLQNKKYSATNTKGDFCLTGKDMFGFKSVCVHKTLNELRAAYEAEGFIKNEESPHLWEIFSAYASLIQEAQARGIQIDYGISPATGEMSILGDNRCTPHDLLEKYITPLRR